MKNYLKSLELLKEVDDKEGLTSLHNNIGGLLVKQHNLPEAMKNFLIAIEIRQKLGNRQKMAPSYGGIGDIHAHQANYAEALSNYCLPGMCTRIRRQAGHRSCLFQGWR